MPELPEVEVVRRSIWAQLAGARVRDVEVGSQRLRAPLDAGALSGALPGTRLERVGRRGKYLLLYFDSVVTIVHLGMSGRLTVVATGTARVLHTHLILVFEGDRELRFVDPRRFGMVAVVSAAGLEAYSSLARLGPDAIEAGAPAALGAARRSVVPIHCVLLDQTVIAGLGNIYACEALFRSRVRPTRRAASLSAACLVRLAEASKRVLEEAIEAGGTTLEDGGFVNATGKEGFFVVRLDVYGREGQPCRSCGHTIRREVLRGRSVYFCPCCQR